MKKFCMGRVSGMNRILSRAAALAMVALLAVPVMGITAFAAENGDNNGHQYVISGEGPGEFQHNEDCRQERRGVVISPEDEAWRGHDDRFCYKTGLTVTSPDVDPDEQSGIDEDAGQDLDENAQSGDNGGDAVIHDDTCFQKDVLVCDQDGDEDHQHGKSCYQTGWVDDMPGVEHDDVKDTHVPRLSSPKAGTMADSMLADAGLIGRVFDALLDNGELGATAAAFDGNEIMGADLDSEYEPLPSTGGEGTAILMALGMLGAAAGAFTLFGTRRRFDI